MTTDYATAALAARHAVFGEGEVPRETLRVLVKTARDLAPDDEQRAIWDRYSKALSDGHRLAVKNFPTAILSVDGAPLELVADVEAIFAKENST